MVWDSIAWYSNLLWDGWSRDQILLGVEFSAPVQTNPDAHPACYTMGTRSQLEIKQLECGLNCYPSSWAKVKYSGLLYLCSPPVLSWQVIMQHFLFAYEIVFVHPPPSTFWITSTCYINTVLPYFLSYPHPTNASSLKPWFLAWYKLCDKTISRVCLFSVTSASIQCCSLGSSSLATSCRKK